MLLARIEPAAHRPCAPGVEEALRGLEEAVIPERREAFLQGPGAAGLEVGLVQVTAFS